MKSNLELKIDVQNELKWEYSLIDAIIDVNVCDGVVTLTGVVDSILKKQSAIWATKQVLGVRAITVKILVNTLNPVSFKKSGSKNYENIYSIANENLIEVPID